MFGLRSGQIIDIIQTATLAGTLIVLIWALLMVRNAFTEGVRLLRESLDRLHALEKRADEIEARQIEEPPQGNR